VTTATREGRLIVFDEAWQTIRERYYDPRLHGVDWEELRARLRPLAAEAASETEFYSVLRRLTSRLRDAHTRVFSPDERFDWQRLPISASGCPCAKSRARSSSRASSAGARPRAAACARATLC
jgi:hypothetical protein